MSKSIESLDKNFIPESVDGDNAWYDAVALGLEGKPFADTQAPYDRLPARANGVVTENVWALSKHSAGLAVRFVTDSPTISARWSLTNANLAMNHMAATGVSGLDLYGYDEGGWIYVGTGRPTQKDNNEQRLIGGLKPGLREYILYLPLYNGTASLYIGVKPGSKIGPAAADSPTGAGRKPLVFYGTSIVQGGCASRTGMAYPAILARNLNYPHINLGFSGNGPMHLEMVQFLGEIDATCYIIDAVPNMNEQLVAERTIPFIEGLRALRPTTPIIVVENILYQHTMLSLPEHRGHINKNIQLRKQFGQLVNKGVPGLHYLSGTNLLGPNNLGTVDGVHPTDLGFFHMAITIGQAVTEALNTPFK